MDENPFVDQYLEEELEEALEEAEADLEEAENDLDEEATVDEFEDGDDPGVSATADEGGAEASTPGAVARAGGDPDELEPLTSVPEGVVNEIPTSGPLPNTGGMSLLYWLLPLAGLLLLVGLPVYRWANSRR